MQSFEFSENLNILVKIRWEHADIQNDDSVLSFSIDILRNAGASLGEIKSTLPPPRTTYEDLARRAEALLAQVRNKERRDA